MQQECFVKRTLLASLPHGRDLAEALQDIIRQESITLGVFTLIGAVRCASFGYYDQRGKAYKHISRDIPCEIASCSGNISMKEGSPMVHAHILFGAGDGSAFGGHLMSPTTIFAAELHLTELEGEPPVRRYDEATGLMLWKQ